MRNSRCGKTNTGGNEVVLVAVFCCCRSATRCGCGSAARRCCGAGRVVVVAVLRVAAMLLDVAVAVRTVVAVLLLGAACWM